jgi:hypothetical protein
MRYGDITMITNDYETNYNVALLQKMSDADRKRRIDLLLYELRCLENSVIDICGESTYANWQIYVHIHDPNFPSA